jgi:phosphoribosyl 1,2-cyclic phosphate phosphodiesterase
MLFLYLAQKYKNQGLKPSRIAFFGIFASVSPKTNHQPYTFSMRITFLGTGTSMGVPVIACKCEVCQSQATRDKRLRSSVLVEINGKTILIDAGPDFRQQMLMANVSHIDGILLTHGHTDHVGGLDDVRAINWQMQRPMPIYAEGFVLDELKQRYAYAFAEHKYPGVPEYQLITIGTSPFFVGDVAVIPIRVWHHKLPVLGFRFGNLAYITDANRIDNSEMDKLRNLDVLIINGLREEEHLSHFSLSEALNVISELLPKRAFITHISHQMGLHNSVNAQLPPNVVLAYDGLVLEV